MDAWDWVMENGPWYIAGRPIILRVWQPGMEMLNIQLTYLPIWVKFYNIPLEYWTNTCLGYIASAVGKPLHMDSLTENRTKISFARICIEVDLSSKFPKAARLNLGNGKCTTIRIEYLWVPHNCSHCQVFGHKVSQCPFSKAPPVPESGEPSGSKIASHGNGEKVNSRSKLHNVATPGVELGDGVDSVVNSIGARQSTVSLDNIGVTSHGAVTPPMRHANRFEYLAISEALTDEVAEVASTDAPTDEVVELVSNGNVIPDTAEYSDSWPICDSFKHVEN